MEQKSNGALMGSIIIIVILIIGGWYVWKTSVKQKIQQNNGTTVNTPSDNPDDVSNIEQGLNDVKLDTLDSGI